MRCCSKYRVDVKLICKNFVNESLRILKLFLIELFSEYLCNVIRLVHLRVALFDQVRS